MTDIRDDNDRAIVGKLPDDPTEDAKPINEQPRILSVAELLRGSAERAIQTRDVRDCVTGCHELDDRTGGLLPGWCWVVGADTNWGKSTWAVSVADENLQLGKGVLVVSAEDPEDLYGDRLMLRRSGVNADNFRKKRLQPAELERIDRVAREGEPKPVFLDARGKSAEWVARQVGRALDALDLDVVIYDYLQEFRSEKRQQDRRNEVSEVAKMLRDPVKSRRKSALILSQITVSDKRNIPSKHDIRESRDVSNAAEVVALGFTPEQDVKDENGATAIEKGTRCMLLDKVKQGRKGIVKLDWDDYSARFRKQEGPDDHLDELSSDFDDGFTDLAPDYREAPQGADF